MLKEQGIAFREQAPIRVTFHGIEMGEFLADLLVDNRVLVELKAVRTLEQTHERQLLNYLRATEIEVGLLFNFGPRPQFRRLVFDNDRKGEQRVQPHPTHEPLTPIFRVNPRPIRAIRVVFSAVRFRTVNLDDEHAPDELNS